MYFSGSNPPKHVCPSDKEKKKTAVFTRDSATQQPPAAVCLVLILFPLAEMPH